MAWAKKSSPPKPKDVPAFVRHRLAKRSRMTRDEALRCWEAAIYGDFESLQSDDLLNLLDLALHYSVKAGDPDNVLNQAIDDLPSNWYTQQFLAEIPLDINEHLPPADNEILDSTMPEPPENIKVGKANDDDLRAIREALFSAPPVPMPPPPPPNRINHGYPRPSHHIPAPPSVSDVWIDTGSSHSDDSGYDSGSDDSGDSGDSGGDGGD